jgi:hypothetical protein
MKAAFMYGAVGPRPSPLRGWLTAEYGATWTPHIVYPGLRKPRMSQPSVNTTGPTIAPGANQRVIT